MNERTRPDPSGAGRGGHEGVPPEVGLGTSELVHAFRARFFQVAGIVGLTVLVVAFLTALTPPRYTATAAVTVGFGGGNPFEPLGMSVQHVSKQLSDAYMTTQTDIVASLNVARKVVDRLGLAADAGYIDLHREAGSAGGRAIEDWIAFLLLDDLDADLSLGLDGTRYLAINDRHHHLGVYEGNIRLRAYDTEGNRQGSERFVHQFEDVAYFDALATMIDGGRFHIAYIEPSGTDQGRDVRMTRLNIR